MSQQYNDESIKALKGADRIRKRPEVMLTKRNIEGARHTVIEIVGNALDECGAGYGDTIEVTYHKDFSVTVRDYGRGVPMGYNESEERWNWDLIYNEMYAGGKYIDEDITEEIFNQINVNDPRTLKSFVYLFPIGTNGLGGFASQASSEFFEVCSYYNEVQGNTETPMRQHRMRFTKGLPDFEEVEISLTDEKRGTKIHWKPDCKEVFINAKDDDLGFEWLFEYFKEIANVKGYTFILMDESSGEKHTIEGKGLDNLIRDKCGKNIAYEAIYKKESWKKGNYYKGKADSTVVVRYLAKAEVALAFTKKTVVPICFHNSVKMLRGVTYSGIESAVDQFFSERAREFGVKLRPDDYREYVTCVVSTYSTTTSYENQTKQGVSDGFLYEMVYDTVYNMLLVEYGKGNKDLKEIIQDVVESAITRQKIQEYEKQKRAASRVSRTRQKPNKFIECDLDDPNKIELWIPEGDSALNGLLSARDKHTQALLPVRGKVLNCLKASLERILDSSVIKDLFAVLGCGMDLPKSDLFDIDNLKFDKIIFATDADEDGRQIRVLLFLIFYRLAPELLRQGHVYIAETPLFENVLTTGRSVFAYNSEEQESVLEKYSGQIRVIHRSKGIGENDPDMIWSTTMNPETRRLVPLLMETEDEISMELIDCMFGADRGKQRKNVIMNLIGADLGDVISYMDIPEEVDLEV